jgi:dienelactone hydrolase
MFLLVMLFASCSSMLRPGAGNKHRNGNAKKPAYNISNFTGTVVKNVVYRTAPNYEGNQQQLAIDVYKPANAEGKAFPAIFLLHGGSFVGGDKANLAATCAKLAEAGYVAISVNYRLGWGFVSRASASCNDTTVYKQAVYRAIQDAHAAMRYVAAHANEYNIDKNWVFVGGQSAGAVTALFAAYLQQETANNFFSKFSDKLGALDEGAKEDFTIKGVISMWGAFLNPSFITAQTALPTIFFQGEKDKAVPFKSRPFAPCLNATNIYGTYYLYNRLKDLNVTAIAHVDPQGGHGVFEEDFRVKNILCFLNDVRQGVKKNAYLTGVQNSCDK